MVLLEIPMMTALFLQDEVPDRDQIFIFCFLFTKNITEISLYYVINEALTA